MTHLSIVPRSLRLSHSTRLWPVTLLAAGCLAALAGWVAGSPAESAASVLQAGSALTLLLRFMAGLKALFALALVLLAVWRLGYKVKPVAAWLYVGATALMCAAPGLIWHMNHVAIGALVFHAGFLLFLGTAWRDGTKPATRATIWLARSRTGAARGERSKLHPAN